MVQWLYELTKKIRGWFIPQASIQKPTEKSLLQETIQPEVGDKMVESVLDIMSGKNYIPSATEVAARSRTKVAEPVAANDEFEPPRSGF